MNLERQKENFKDHKATFTDFGNIKILDFKKPNSSYYRIRFLFEEDFYRLHISGDLGELIAANYCNMCWDKFEDFTDNIGYFNGKIICHNRPIFAYDYETAKADVMKHIKEYDLYDEVIDDQDEFMSEEDIVEEFLEDVFDDFTEESGIGHYGYEKLSEIDPDIFEVIGDFGKKSTGILDLYMLAFKLAKEQLENTLKVRKNNG